MAHVSSCSSSSDPAAFFFLGVDESAAHSLEVSLTKRLSHGLQFLASYTFSKTLDTDGADINSTSAGVLPTLGD